MDLERRLIRHIFADDIWTAALLEGAEKLMKSGKHRPESRELGAINEYVGYVFLDEYYFHDNRLTSPGEIEGLQNVVPEQVRKEYGLAFPDALILDYIGRYTFSVQAAVEYKIPDIEMREIDKLRKQFQGFKNFLRMLTERDDIANTVAPRIIIRPPTYPRPKLIVSDQAKIIYLVPKDRSARDIAPKDQDLEEIKLPLTRDEILEKMRLERQNGFSTIPGFFRRWSRNRYTNRQ